jgi:hypothetical protein
MTERHLPPVQLRTLSDDDLRQVVEALVRFLNVEVLVDATREATVYHVRRQRPGMRAISARHASGPEPPKAAQRRANPNRPRSPRKGRNHQPKAMELGPLWIQGKRNITSGHRNDRKKWGDRPSIFRLRRRAY